MPIDILKQSMKGEHTMHHNPGIFNGVWSDMFIESTYMRYGHGPGGVVGVTLKPGTLETWSLSLHLCAQLEHGLQNMDANVTATIQNKHKEEFSARILADSKDRLALRNKLQLCFDPLDPSHPTSPVNSVTGQIALPDINLDRAVEIGITSMRKFEANWPEGFHDPITKQI